MAREKIIALGKKMTDRIPYKLGLEKLTESDPEYYGLECVVTDDEADVALAMDLRKPTTPEKIAKKMGKPVSYVQKIMDDLSTPRAFWSTTTILPTAAVSMFCPFSFPALPSL